MDQSFSEARLAIGQVRHVEILKALAHYGPDTAMDAWIRGVVVDCQRLVRPTMAAFARKAPGSLAHIPIAWGYSCVNIHTHTHALIRDDV